MFLIVLKAIAVAAASVLFVHTIGATVAEALTEAGYNLRKWASPVGWTIVLFAVLGAASEHELPFFAAWILAIVYFTMEQAYVGRK